MNKKKFSELNKQIQVERCTIPQAVFSTLDPDDETDAQIIRRQENFLKLSDDTKDKLVSREIAKKIENIGKRYGLELIQMASIARAIRNYYFEEIELDQFPEIFTREIGLPENKAQDISRYVIRDVIEQKSPGSEIVKITLSDAIKKYPALGEQLITTSPIAPTSPGGETKRPSLKNWINDYVNIMGREKHTAIERSRYLYGSKSTRNISASEKHVLSEMIRALEENLPVNVDLTRNKVMLSRRKRERSARIPAATSERSVPQKRKEVTQNKQQIIKRAQEGNMELSSDHHNNEGAEENIKSVKFDAPHRLPNEK
ncbi:hypothetical protein ACFL2R_01700 [Patescibacteria group bacterium]